MEAELVAWLIRRAPRCSQTLVPIGDDAAVVDLQGTPCVTTTDLLIDGVHFRLADDGPRRVGRKALAVNLSDLAAMAARPVAALVSLAIPRSLSLAAVQEFYEGLFPLAEEFDCPLVGGDTNRGDGPLVVSVTALGIPGPKGVWRRDGGRPGDWLLATGELGGSILGRHYDFIPRVREALHLAERYDIAAACDLSDGLALDLDRLARASGCGAALEPENVPVSAAAEQLTHLRGDGVAPLDHALSDGEDFELLLAARPEVARRLLTEQPLAIPLAHVGELIEQPGLWITLPDGSLAPLAPRGYLHE